MPAPGGVAQRKVFATRPAFCDSQTPDFTSPKIAAAELASRSAPQNRARMGVVAAGDAAEWLAAIAPLDRFAPLMAR
jgi:hypothetical protein